MTKDQWITEIMNNNKKADKQVLLFIANILFHDGYKNKETIKKLFSLGYCYYFAKMLQTAFNRGTICYAYHKMHIVWLDGDIAYDINGVNKDWKYLIPIEKLENYLIDFMHVPGIQTNDDKFDSFLLNLIETKQFIKESKHE